MEGPAETGALAQEHRDTRRPAPPAAPDFCPHIDGW